MPNLKRHTSGIAIVNEANGRPTLFVEGQRVDVRGGYAQLALLACFLNNLGRAVPYRRLFIVIGRKSDNSHSRHLLRQYMSMLRETLLANKARFFIATVHEVGYALRELAENQRHNSRTRHRKDLPRLARNLRQFRVAAGLTQTALAKRSGMHRSYLSDLENGGRNAPTPGEGP